mgnify:CR=1 FL=1
MKICPQCSKDFGEEYHFCPDDGTPLVNIVKQDDPLIGKVVKAKYEVVEMIREDNLGRIFKARQQPLGRTVVLEIFHYHLTREEKFHFKLGDAIRKYSKLQHVNIGTIYDMDETDDNRFFITSEFVDGRSLDAVLNSEAPLSQERIINIFYQIADALHQAHANLIEHGYLTPQDVIIYSNPDGKECVQIMNFGISKILLNEKLRHFNKTLDSTYLTVEEVSYISPDQASGAGDVDDLDDVYAFGVILYHALSGALPFQADTAEAMIEALSTLDPVPLRNLPQCRTLHPLWDSVLEKCIQKVKTNRYQSIKEVKLTMQRISDSIKHDAEPTIMRMKSELEFEMGSTAAPVIKEELDTTELVPAPVGPPAGKKKSPPLAKTFMIDRKVLMDEEKARQLEEVEEPEALEEPEKLESLEVPEEKPPVIAAPVVPPPAELEPEPLADQAIQLEEIWSGEEETLPTGKLQKPPEERLIGSPADLLMGKERSSAFDMFDSEPEEAPADDEDQAAKTIFIGSQAGSQPEADEGKTVFIGHAQFASGEADEGKTLFIGEARPELPAFEPMDEAKTVFIGPQSAAASPDGTAKTVFIGGPGAQPGSPEMARTVPLGVEVPPLAGSIAERPTEPVGVPAFSGKIPDSTLADFQPPAPVLDTPSPQEPLPFAKTVAVAPEMMPPPVFDDSATPPCGLPVEPPPPPPARPAIPDQPRPPAPPPTPPPPPFKPPVPPPVSRPPVTEAPPAQPVPAEQIRLRGYAPSPTAQSGPEQPEVLVEPAPAKSKSGSGLKIVLILAAVFFVLAILAGATYFGLQLLKPQKGGFTVNSYPDQAQVMLDGDLLGSTPLTQENIDVGTYRLKVSKTGYQTVEKEVTIEKNQTLNLELIKLTKVDTPVTPGQPGQTGPVTDDQVAQIEDFKTKAELAFSQKRYLDPPEDCAIYFCQQIQAINPDDPYAAEMRARVADVLTEKAAKAAKAKDWIQAEKLYGKLVELKPEDAAVKQSYDTAAAQMKLMMEKKTETIRDLTKKAEAAFAQGRLVTPPDDNAYEHCLMIKKLEKNNKFANAMIQKIKTQSLGQVDDAINGRNYDQAKNILLAYNRYFPGDSNAYIKLNTVNQKLSEQDVNRQRQEEENSRQATLARGKSLLASGLADFKRGSFSSAVAQLSESVEIDPNQPDAWLYLGASYLELKNYGKAQECFRKVVQMRPDNGEAHLYLALIAKDERAYHKAIEHLRRVIQLGGVPPNYPIEKLNALLGEMEARKNFSVMINRSIAVDHKHFIGGCTGYLIFTAEAIKYETSESEHAFTIPLKNLQNLGFGKSEELSFQIGDKKYRFNIKNANAFEDLRRLLPDYVRVLQ